jgi:5-methylcytosine-specific restriction endonuclease McrA
MDERPDLDKSALRLAERLIQLLDEGSFTATYKYAVLIGLMDLCMELTSATGSPPDVITTRQLAEKVIELYWSHCMPYTDGVLRQSASGQQAEIVQRVLRFRESVGGVTLAAARRASGAEPYEQLARTVEWKLVEMPIPKLQNIGQVEDRFIYEYNFPRRLDNQRLLQPYWEGQGEGFDNRLLLRDNVGASLIALNGVLRPLIHRQWAMMVAKLNGREEAALEKFLFGHERIPLDPVRRPLRELQDHRCFYCDDKLSTKYEVDHFIPWARHADDGIHNLVAADQKCNGRKHDYLAAAEHVERWRRRARESASDLAEIARKASWESRPDRTLSVARAIYQMLPEDARLWRAGDEFIVIERGRIAAALAA